MSSKESRNEPNCDTDVKIRVPGLMLKVFWQCPLCAHDFAEKD